MRNTQPALTVHIAQFAALLRDRQVVIAFHERALFDYLNAITTWRFAEQRSKLGNMDCERRLGMSRAVLKFARQASLVDQATRPWVAVQGRS